MIKGHSNNEPDVKEREVIEYCLENNIFYIKIDGETNKGLKEAFESGPVQYLLRKENNIESLILKESNRKVEYL
jgi:hypothetical protein